MADSPTSETGAGQAVKCLTCGAIIQSKHRHNFVLCDCGLQSDTGIYVDGGTAYFRMGVGKDARYEVVNEEARHTPDETDAIRQQHGDYVDEVRYE